MAITPIDTNREVQKAISVRSWYQRGLVAPRPFRYLAARWQRSSRSLATRNTSALLRELEKLTAQVDDVAARRLLGELAGLAALTLHVGVATERLRSCQP